METYNKLKNNYIFYISTPARPKGKIKPRRRPLSVLSPGCNLCSLCNSGAVFKMRKPRRGAGFDAFVQSVHFFPSRGQFKKVQIKTCHKLKNNCNFCTNCTGAPEREKTAATLCKTQFQIPHSTFNCTLHTPHCTLKKAPRPLQSFCCAKRQLPQGGALFLWRLRRIILGRFFQI